jgi:hypothetical protein
MTKTKIGAAVVLVAVSLGLIALGVKAYFQKQASSRLENKNKNAGGSVANYDQAKPQAPSAQTKVS